MIKTILLVLCILVSFNASSEEIEKECVTANECIFKVGEHFKFSVVGIGSVLPLSTSIYEMDEKMYHADYDVANYCVRVLKKGLPNNGFVTIGFFSTRTGDVYTGDEKNESCPTK